MSYIHCYNNNYYKPSENLTNLFEEQVIQPFEDNLPELAADVENKRRFYWDDIRSVYIFFVVMSIAAKYTKPR